MNEQRYQEFYECYKQYTPDLPLEFFTRRSQDVMAAADVVVVTSGTATLETMLYKKPMVIAYRMSKLTYQIVKRLVHVPYVGLPNLLSNQFLVPELLQDKVSPERICEHVLDYLDHPEKVRDLQNKFTEIHKELQMDSSHCIANALLDIMQRKAH